MQNNLIWINLDNSFTPTYEEIKDYIKCYENIYEGVFSNDCSKEYGNKNVKFIKIFEIF